MIVRGFFNSSVWAMKCSKCRTHLISYFLWFNLNIPDKTHYRGRVKLQIIIIKHTKNKYIKNKVIIITVMMIMQYILSVIWLFWSFCADIQPYLHQFAFTWIWKGWKHFLILLDGKLQGQHEGQYIWKGTANDTAVFHQLVKRCGWGGVFIP